jgi:hypothetical protein
MRLPATGYSERIARYSFLARLESFASGEADSIFGSPRLPTVHGAVAE